MKKNTKYQFISFILSFLLIFTSSCSNLSAIFTKNTVSNPIISNNNNFIRKNSEYKKFSTKAGEPVGTSITLSKQYVFSSRTNNTWQTTDYDISNQPPNKVKITAITNKSDVANGADFVIDGVTTFNVPAPCDAGNYLIGTSNNVITVTDIDSTHKQFEFLWDGKNVDGSLVKEGVYTIHVLKTSGTKTLFLDTEINVTSDPLVASGMKFFEPKDFRDLVDKIEAVNNIPTELSDSLYNKAIEIQTLNSKLFSLQSRIPQDLSKISEIQEEITNANSSRLSLTNSILTELNKLDEQKTLIRTYLNTISNNSLLSVDYPSTDKPDDINNYIILSNHYYGDFSVALSSSKQSLYLKDESDTGPNDFKQKWEVSAEKNEKIDVRSLFKGANAFLNEIQTAKNLIEDYNNSSLISNDLKNEETISGLVARIKYHKGILKTKSTILARNYQRAYLEIRKSAINLHNSILLPLAITMSKISDFHNNAFVLQALKFNVEGLNDADSDKLQIFTDLFVNVLATYVTSSSLVKEKALAIWLGKSEQQIKEIKDKDTQYGTNVLQSLIDETTAIIQEHIAIAAIIPRTVYYSKDVIVDKTTKLVIPQNEVEMATFMALFDFDMSTGFTQTLPSIGAYLATKWGLNIFASKLLNSKLTNVLTTDISAEAKRVLGFKNTARVEGEKVARERIEPKLFANLPCFKAGYHTNGLEECLEIAGQKLGTVGKNQDLRDIFYNEGAVVTSRKILVEGGKAPLLSEQLVKLEQIIISDAVNGTNFFKKVLLGDPTLDYTSTKFFRLNGVKNAQGKTLEKSISEALLDPIDLATIQSGTGQEFLLNETINIYKNLIGRGGVQVKRYGLKDASGNFLPDIELFYPDFESLVTTNPVTGRSIFTVPITDMNGQSGGFGTSMSNIPSKDFKQLVKGIGDYLRNNGYLTITDEEVRAFVKSQYTGHHNNIIDMLLFPNKLHTGKVGHSGGNKSLNIIDSVIKEDAELRELLNDATPELKSLFTLRLREK